MSRRDSGAALRVVPPPATTPRRPPRRITGIVDQVEAALAPANRLPTGLGFVLGGVVPAITFELAHGGLVAGQALYAQPAAWIVLGGLLFSALTVFQWSAKAFASRPKALGFVVLAEGTMVCAPAAVGWLAWVPLVLLVGINGVATGCRLSLDRKGV